MATAKQFEDLGVWQDARALVKTIYATSKQRAFYRDIGLREQIRRAASSTMSNIAEGFERGTRKEFIQFLNIARRSSAELASMALTFERMKILDTTATSSVLEMADKVGRKLTSLIRHLGRGNR